MAQKYQELSDKIVGLVGGKANVQFFTHCVTRLRFNVKDESAVKKDEIEKLPGVLGSQWQNGQYQIIIGQAVNDAYRLICEKNGFAVFKSGDLSLCVFADDILSKSDLAVEKLIQAIGNRL